MYDLGEVLESTEIGLKCPDGTVIWPPQTYREIPLNTPEERAQIPGALRRFATEVNLEAEALVASYAWVVRAKTTFTIYNHGSDTYALDSLPTTEPAAEPTSTPNQ